MNVDEAIEMLERDIDRHRSMDIDDLAVKGFIVKLELLISGYRALRQEVTRLAIESIEREKLCARLEAEVKQAILGVKEM